MKTVHFIAIALMAIVCSSCERTPKEVERPERVVSLNKVMYDSATYGKLATLWQKYNDVFPSEDAYANWMYAAHYAEIPDYATNLKKGVEKYPSNPVLLYLKARLSNTWQVDLESQQLLQRASALDPEYMDPWHALTISYLAHGDRENVDATLRRLLNGRAVDDEIMDFSYNMIACLDSNAILITNGDNDTWPGWILTRIIRYRPDVKIVNRSLLNTDWYPSSVETDGVPAFASAAVRDSLRTQVAAEIASVQSGKLPWHQVSFLGDRLVERLIEAAETAGRPVYFACTLEREQAAGLLKKYANRSSQLGLVTLVTATPKQYPNQVRRLLTTWLTEFRTSGLDSWHLRSAQDARAGKVLVRNYSAALKSLKDQIHLAGPETQLEMFRWYRKHLQDVLPRDDAAELNVIWCNPAAPGKSSHGARSRA